LRKLPAKRKHLCTFVDAAANYEGFLVKSLEKGAIRTDTELEFN